jgi:hypothetical protein
MDAEQTADQPRGVAFPRAADGHRSTAAVGRTVVADALRAVDPAGAFAAEAGLGAPGDAVAIASSGLDSLHAQMSAVLADGRETGVDGLLTAAAERSPDTVEVHGDAEPETELSLPYHGERLRGDELLRRLDGWAEDGVIEPSCAAAVREVVAHPEWLRLEGRTVAVLGAGAEIGPLPSLLRWGARVAAVDLPRPEIWTRVLATARRSAGALVLPVDGPAGGGPDDDADLAARAGADLIAEVPAVADWLGSLDGTLVVGNYVYADGGTNVRVSVAVDALTRRLQAARDGVDLAFLATPTDVFAVPGDAVDQATRSYEQRSSTAKLLGRPLRGLSGGRLLRRAYRPGVDPGVIDSLVPQQGPNYALAKRLQRWRATVARDAGTTVSLNVAPPTRTKSVVKNRALAAAYAGAHRFGVEVFEPATCNVLMAALLVHDLNTGGGPRHEHTWQDEAYAAAHGGLWRAPYAPRSALGLAALLGYGAARA